MHAIENDSKEFDIPEQLKTTQVIPQELSDNLVDPIKMENIDNHANKMIPFNKAMTM